MEATQLKALEAFINNIKGDPSVVHGPDLAFFKQFLESWGCKVPPAGMKSAPTPEPQPKPKVETPAKEESSEEEPEEPEELVEEEEDPERLPEDTEAFPEKGPAGEIELSDEQMDKQGELKSAAAEALEDGDSNKALEKYTEAMKIGNTTAMMFSKRAEILLKLKRCRACIADCTSALEVNPDSAKAYRVRGKAYRKLGCWEEAHKDLSESQKLDFDDETADVQKFVDARWKTIAERRQKQKLRQDRIDKKRKEKETKRRKVEATRAYEEAKAAEAAGGGFPGGMGGGMPPGGFPGGMGGMPGGMGGMPGGMGGMPGMPAGIDPSMLQGLMSDPELMAAFSNPKMMAAMQDIMSNPGNISKYQSDPEIMNLMQKVMGKMGGGMDMGGMDGMPGKGGGKGASPSSGPTVEEVDENNDVNDID